ncbi:unnamed protein product [Urochloa humidicola]
MATINSTSTVKHGQSLPETSSRCVTGSVTAAHNFEVTNFWQLDGMGARKFVSSSTFSVGGYDWRIHFYPDGNTKEDRGVYVSVYLYFQRGIDGATVEFSLSLLGKDNQALNHQVTATWTAPSAGSDWGWSKFIEKSKLKELLRLNGDRFKIRCVLTLIAAPHTQEGRAIEIPESKLHQDLTDMLKNREGADVTFRVRDQLFPSHKCILAARSTVFKAELFGAMKEKDTQCIKIDDMEPTVFEALLHFIYTDSLLDFDCDADKNAAMQHLLVAADRYGLDRLRLMCEAKLCQGIDVETVATTLALADQHRCTQLKDACLSFIASRNVLGVVKKTDGFKHLTASCPSIMNEILDKVAAVWID